MEPARMPIPETGRCGQTGCADQDEMRSFKDKEATDG